MSSLNFESHDPKPKGGKRSLKIILGIGTIVGVVALGSTLASSITLNSGNPVEFGQGVTQAVACDNEITVTARSKFINGNYTDFSAQSVLDAIELSGVDLSEEGYDYQNDESASLEDQAAHPGQYKNSDGNWTNTCSGKKFVIKIFTKQSGYVNFTVDGNINSPLALNQYLTPDGNELYNRAMLIGPFSGDFKFEDCYSLAVNLSDNYGWNYDICYANNSISYGSGSKSDFDNATLRYVVTDDPDLIERTGYYNSPTEYELYMGAPAAAVDSITIESMDEIPDGFN